LAHPGCALPCGHQDECRQWDINDVVFTPAMWRVYEPLLRADFKLFDEYKYRDPPVAAVGQGGPAPAAGVQGHGAPGPPAGVGVNATASGEQVAASDGRRAPPPFEFPILAFWGGADRRVGRPMVERWRLFTAGRFEVVGLPRANHLWPSNNREAKAAWLARVTAEIAAHCSRQVRGISD
jgi:medium-chain acyl-[acyl-carrier-protein] hydrolase